MRERRAQPQWCSRELLTYAMTWQFDCVEPPSPWPEKTVEGCLPNNTIFVRAPMSQPTTTYSALRIHLPTMLHLSVLCVLRNTFAGQMNSEVALTIACMLTRRRHTAVVSARSTARRWMVSSASGIAPSSVKFRAATRMPLRSELLSGCPDNSTDLTVWCVLRNGYSYSTALGLSVMLGNFGVDRCRACSILAVLRPTHLTSSHGYTGSTWGIPSWG